MNQNFEQFELNPEFKYIVSESETNRNSSEYIKWVQASLNQILGINLVVDGAMGTNTRSAVRSFQKQYGLTVDGVVGPNTEKAIGAAIASKGSPVSGSKKQCRIIDDFDFDKDNIKPIHEPTLQAIAKVIIDSQKTSAPIHAIDITGHTDKSGSEKYNTGLGHKRGEQVKRYLIQSIERIKPGSSAVVSFNLSSKGETEAVNPVAAKNRKVEICYPKTSYKPPAPTGTDRPLKLEDLLKVIKPRPALKSAVNIPIEIPLIVSPSSSLQIVSPSNVLSEIARQGNSLSRYPKLRITGSLGTYLSPPSCELISIAKTPREQLIRLQKEHRSLPGFLPDHLPLLPLPSLLPDELKASSRINPQLFKQTPKGYHRPTTFFSPENRRVFRDTSYPWSTIGLVETPTGSCTGTMVGPRHVLTASHCINWLAGNKFSWVRFTPAYFNGGVPPFGSAHGLQIRSYVKVDPSDLIDREEGQYDYVVVILDSRLGDKTGFMGSRSWSDDWDDEPYWSHVGYPDDITSGQRPSFENKIAMDGSFWDRQVHTRIFHKADVSVGQSGGPFFAWWANLNGPQIVAVQSGENDDENLASGGADMVELISNARRDFP